MSAKKYLFFLIIAAAALNACKKKKNEKDNITFHEFTPNIEINSLDSFCISTQDVGYLPVTSSQEGLIIRYGLDIDNDSKHDFEIQVKKVANPSGGFSTQYPSSNVLSEMTIKTLYSENKITRLLSENDVIDEDNSKWSNYLTIDGFYAPAYIIGTRYIGFQFKRGEHYNYGWLKLSKFPSSTNKHGLILMSFAYNNTLDNKILAGQEQ